MNYTFCTMYAFLLAFFPTHTMQLVNFFTTMKKRMPVHIEVPVSGAATISLAPEQEKIKSISTYGLIGCTATITCMKNTKGKHVVLTHFPYRDTEHAPALEQHIRPLVAQDKPEAVTFITITPRKNEELHDEHHEAYCEQMKNELETVVRTHSGCDNKDIRAISVEYNVSLRPIPSRMEYPKTDVFVRISNSNKTFVEITGFGDRQNFELE